jgi:hypothetical protein
MTAATQAPEGVDAIVTRSRGGDVPLSSRIDLQHLPTSGKIPGVSPDPGVLPWRTPSRNTGPVGIVDKDTVTRR